MADVYYMAGVYYNSDCYNGVCNVNPAGLKLSFFRVVIDTGSSESWGTKKCAINFPWLIFPT